MIIKKGKIIHPLKREVIKSSPELNTEIIREDFSVSTPKERQERRRGDRRRGYRRVDDRNIISRAHEEANAIKEKAAKEGFDYGLNQLKGELKKINTAIAEFIKAKESAYEKLTPEISFLALKVAEKIIKKHVEEDPEIVLKIVSEVLKKIGRDENFIIIRTNPADTKLVRDNLPKIFRYADTNAKITVSDDDDVEWGSCIVETTNGLIDARFSTQIEILKKAFETSL
jgi:flagellar assembly protein FliH